MIFLCYPQCTTCQKAKKWLEENHIAYDLRDIKLETPTYEELAEWLRLLAADGMLVKRPLLIGDDFVLVGFREAEWAERLNAKSRPPL